MDVVAARAVFAVARRAATSGAVATPTAAASAATFASSLVAAAHTHCTTAGTCIGGGSSLLPDARRSYAEHLATSPFLRFALPSYTDTAAPPADLLGGRSAFEPGTVAGGSVLRAASALLAKIGPATGRLWQWLAGVVAFLMRNPVHLAAGGVTIAAIGGVVYLSVSRLIADQAAATAAASASATQQPAAALRSASAASAPDHLCCPITCELFRDPVMLVASGHTFEREAAEAWLAAGNATCPMTRLPVAQAGRGAPMSAALVPNIAMRHAVEAHVVATMSTQ